MILDGGAELPEEVREPVKDFPEAGSSANLGVRSAQTADAIPHSTETA
jgi:hypothetical protein